MEIKVLASSSRGNCYYITDGVTPLLLECGIPWKEIQRSLNFQTSNIDGCLISHSHKDHCKSANDVMRAGIDIYTNAPTMAEIQPKDGYSHRWNLVGGLKQFDIGTWTILPFDLEHDVTNFGYLLYSKETKEKLLFATDTYYIRYRFPGLTHIMVECNHAADILQANVDAGRVPVDLKNRLIKSHFSLDNVKEFFKANDLSQVQEIHLLHLSDGNSDAIRFKREIMELTGKAVYVAGE